MKTMLMVTFLSLSYVPSAISQEETLFGSDIESGWYGGPFLKTGPVNGSLGLFVGGEGGWIINHQFVLGAKGYILTNPVDIDGLQNIDVGFGCGGIFCGYVVASDDLLHFGIENLVGLGGVYNDVKDYAQYHPPMEYTGDACLVVEPGINLLLNVTKNFRLGAGVTYRYVNGIAYDPGAPYRMLNGSDYENISDADVSGMTAQLIFKFGEF